MHIFEFIFLINKNGYKEVKFTFTQIVSNQVETFLQLEDQLWFCE